MLHIEGCQGLTLSEKRILIFIFFLLKVLRILNFVFFSGTSTRYITPDKTRGTCVQFQNKPVLVLLHPLPFLMCTEWIL